MGKKSSTFDYMHGTGDIGKMMDRYGIEGASYGSVQRGGTQRSMKDVEKDIAAAMMNDYDTRRSFEAAAMAGNDSAKKFAKKGFKAGNIYDGYEAYEGLKKEYVGGGGMNGAKNRAGLTYAAVKADREAQTAEYENQFASIDDVTDIQTSVDDFKEEMMNKLKNGETKQSEYDLKLEQDKQDINEFDEGFTDVGGKLFGDDRKGKNDAGAYVYNEDYKGKVKEGLKGAGIETRGPGSGFYGEGF